MTYGFIPSKMDGTELEFKKMPGMKIPESYSYEKYLPDVLNQGSKPICVPCSLSCYINYYINASTLKESNVDNNVDLKSIYESKKTSGDNGMTFKDALNFLRHTGVNTDVGREKIGRYAKVGSAPLLKQALILNGPCVGALPVYDSERDDFWNRYSGDSFLGGHAIAIVGYDEDGFIIRNSWGKDFGEDGYTVILYEDFEKFIEIWTIY